MLHKKAYNDYILKWTSRQFFSLFRLIVTFMLHNIVNRLFSENLNYIKRRNSGYFVIIVPVKSDSSFVPTLFTISFQDYFHFRWRQYYLLRTNYHSKKVRH
jgi:hypothetical protein